MWHGRCNLIEPSRHSNPSADIIMKKKILLVEDEKYSCYSMGLYLKVSGYEVVSANNGLEAFEMVSESVAQAKPFDLIVTDINMPKMSGMEFLDKLKSAKISCPVLAITGYGNKAMIIKLMRKGCDDYLDKPFEPEEFLERVHVMLREEAHTI